MNIFSYFYHINEAKRGSRHKFYHRWFWDFEKLKGFSLDIWTGKDLRFEFTRGEASDNDSSCNICMGLLFLTISFTFPCPERFLEKRKCIATWGDDREFWLVQGRRYGFYFYHWALCWNWHAKVHESGSSDPWWMHQYIHIDKFFVGEPLSTVDRLQTVEDVYFQLGNKEFKLDRIRFERQKCFRSFIPFVLYNRTWYRLDVKIEKPPMRAGKGENSWDCGDGGTYGLSCEWKGPVPTWQNRDECMKLAVDIYVKGVLKDADRYGGTDGERGIRKGDKYQYIGQKRDENQDALACESTGDLK